MILVSLVNWVVLRLIYKYFILKNQLYNIVKSVLKKRKVVSCEQTDIIIATIKLINSENTV